VDVKASESSADHPCRLLFDPSSAKLLPRVLVIRAKPTSCVTRSTKIDDLIARNRHMPSAVITPIVSGTPVIQKTGDRIPDSIELSKRYAGHQTF
jgi:hypothetical protein